MRSYPKICLENINPEELEALQSQLDGDEEALTDQKDTLEESGTITKDQAEEVKEDLPDDMVMESFTQFPTRTNYVQVMESLNVGLTIVAIAGMVALGAGVILVMRRINEGKSVALKTQIANQEKDRQLSKELASRSEDMRKEAFERITGSNLNELTYRVMFGEGLNSIDKLIGEGSTMNLTSVNKMIDLYAMDDLGYLSKHPEVKDVKDLPSKGKPAEKLATNLVGFISLDIGTTGNSLDHDATSIKQSFSANYLQQAKIGKYDSHDFVRTGQVHSVDYRKTEACTKHAQEVQEMTRKTLPVLTDAIEGLDNLAGLDKAVVAHVKENLREVRKAVEALEVYVWVSNHIVESVNRSATIRDQLLQALEKNPVAKE